MNRSVSNKKTIVLFDPVHAGKYLIKEAVKQHYQVILIFSIDRSIIEKEFSNFNEYRRCLIFFIKSDSQAREIVSSYNIVAVIAGSEPGVIWANKLASELKLPCNDIHKVLASRNKYEMRKLLLKHKIKIPLFAKCTSLSDINDFLKLVKYPIVLKTPEGAGGDLVFVCNSKQEAYVSFNSIIENKNIFGQYTSYAVIEEYIEGEEYAVNVFSDGEKIHATDVWRYNKINNRWGQTIYNDILLMQENSIGEKLKKCAMKAAKVLGLEIGGAHVEIKINSNGELVLIEIGNRLAGGYLSNFCAEYSDFNPFKATIEVFVNGKINISKSKFTFTKNCAHVFIPSQVKGKLKKLVGEKEAENLSSFLKWQSKPKIGLKISPTTFLGDIPTEILMVNTDPCILLDDVQKVHRILKYEIKQSPPSA